MKQNSSKCCCGGEYPNLKVHTLKECYTKYSDATPTPIEDEIVNDWRTVIKPDSWGTYHFGKSEQKKLDKWLRKYRQSLLEEIVKECEGMKYKRDKDGIFQNPDGMGTPTNISYVEGENEGLDVAIKLLTEKMV